ncbi:unnamed protein product, partial [Didymodactylos carnosus]
RTKSEQTQTSFPDLVEDDDISTADDDRIDENLADETDSQYSTEYEVDENNNEHLQAEEETSTSEEEEEIEEEEENAESNNEEQQLITTTDALDEKEIIKIHQLLKKTRKIVTCIRKSSNIDAYVRAQAKIIQIQDPIIIDENDEPPTNSNIKITIGGLVIDFHVRWNSTYLMIKRFIDHRTIINQITASPDRIAGLKTKKIKQMKKFEFSHENWNRLMDLEHVLRPFLEATEILSGRKYQTLSLGFIIKKSLKHFLSREVDGQTIQNIFKRQLLKKLKHYFEETVSYEEKTRALIASYLHPLSYKLMSKEDKRSAEESIILILETTASSVTSSITIINNSTAAPSTPQKKMSKMDRFLINCDYQSETSLEQATTIKEMTIREEIARYISTIEHDTKFDKYWRENEQILKRLAALVREYNITPATSVASESSFSVAGYIQRKQRASLAPSTLKYLMFLHDKLVQGNN